MLSLLFAFSAGGVIVLGMVLNSNFSQKEGMINSILLNYTMATLSSLILCSVMLKTIPAYSELASVPLPYWIGGTLGVLTTYFFNLIMPNVPAVYVILLRFIGQMLTSVLLDYLFFDIFSVGKLLGSLFFLIGLAINARIDRQATRDACSCNSILEGREA